MIKKLGLFAALCYLWAPAAWAKARFMGLEEAVAVSDVVGVVEIAKAERVGEGRAKGVKKGYLTYAQKNTFRFVSIFKNAGFVAFKQGKEQVLWAEHEFVRQGASYSPGRYLVFLASVGSNEWITLNHHYGGLRIDDDENVLKFGWYLDRKDYEKKASLETAKTAIQKAILDKKTVSFAAEIHPRSIYNKWKAGVPCQELVLSVRSRPKKNWPDGLFNCAAFFKKGSITKRKYQSIAKKGGLYDVTASWVKGSLVIGSIKPVSKTDPATQYNLGQMYWRRGGKRNRKAAVKWFRKAAAQNHLGAQGLLGVLYYGLLGWKPDYREAVKWFQKAAAQNNPEAQYFLGLMYNKGHGVKRDDGEAVKWYQKAAAQGYAEAKEALIELRSQNPQLSPDKSE